MIDYSQRLLFSPDEAAMVVPLSGEALRILCRAGKIPGARKVGRLWLIPRESLLRLGSIPDRPTPEPTRPVSDMSVMEREAFFRTRDDLLRVRRRRA